MKRGYLSEYFEGVAVKRLAAVEIDPSRSHQHEFNTTSEMLNFLGRPTEKKNFQLVSSISTMIATSLSLKMQH